MTVTLRGRPTSHMLIRATNLSALINLSNQVTLKLAFRPFEIVYLVKSFNIEALCLRPIWLAVQVKMSYICEQSQTVVGRRYHFQSLCRNDVGLHPPCRWQVSILLSHTPYLRACGRHFRRSRPLPHETAELRNLTHLTYSCDEISNLCSPGYDEMSVECGVAK